MYFIDDNGELLKEINGLTWICNDRQKAKHTVYSDRLFQWDSKKFNKCSNIVWNNTGQYFYNRTPEEIEKFLSLYYDRDIKLIKIYQYENQSNGFPYWRFDYS